LLLKIDPKELIVGVDEYLQDIDISALRAELPESSPRFPYAITPRFLVISYELKHKDGRISYPLAGVYYK
jgi:hypothetical protein